MEFKIFRNIENGFKQIRMYAIAFAVLCSGVSIFAVGYAYYFAEKQREKIYVLDNGKSLMLALSQDDAVVIAFFSQIFIVVKGRFISHKEGTFGIVFNCFFIGR